jgi:hypothetical protein
MTDCDIDIVVRELRPTPNGGVCGYLGQCQTLYIKFYKNGNIDIKSQSISGGFGRGEPSISNLYDLLIINDNIPIPPNIINIFRQLLVPGNCLYTDLYTPHYTNVIEAIKIMKQDLQTSHIPINRNELLKKENIDLLQVRDNLKKENTELVMPPNVKTATERLNIENYRLTDKIYELTNENTKLKKEAIPKSYGLRKENTELDRVKKELLKEKIKLNKDIERLKDENTELDRVKKELKKENTELINENELVNKLLRNEPSLNPGPFMEYKKNNYKYYKLYDLN